MTSRTLSVMMTALLMVATVGCSDDVVSEDDTGLNDEDCPEGQIEHPLTGQCTDASDSNDSNQGDSNQDDSNDGGDQNNQTGSQDCGPGAIDGQACRPDGQLLPGADVTVEGEDCNGEPFSETTSTDENGHYSFDDIDAGDHQLTIESGSFQTQQAVTVYSDQTTDLMSEAAKICIESSAVDIAVIEGVYDDVGSILNNIEVDFDVVGGDLGDASDDAVDFLSDPDELDDYDIIFIECGSLWYAVDDYSVDTDLVMSNIHDFVAGGNSIYVSDQAHPFIQIALPEALDFYNENDSFPDSSWVGANDQYTASVVSNEFETLLGMTTVDLDMVGGWAVAIDSGTDSTVHFQADVAASYDYITNAPMMTTYNHPAPDGGQAIFTSFHNDDQADAVIEEIMEYMIFQL